MYAWISLASGDITTCLMKPPCFRICLLKCPDYIYNPPRLSQMHIASGTIVTLWASQRSNSIVSHGSIKLDEVRLIETKWYEMTSSDIRLCEMTWSDMKWYKIMWNDMKWYKMMWNDMKWHKMMWNDIKWHEVVRNMIWNEKKGLKRIWKDIDRTEYLQSTLHENDRSPHLDVEKGDHMRQWQVSEVISGLSAIWHGKKVQMMFHHTLKDLLKRQHLAFFLMSKEHSILTVNFFPLRDVAGGPCLGVICTKPWKGTSVIFLFGSWA